MTTHRAYGVAVESLDVAVVEDSRPMQTLLRSMLAAQRVGRIRVYDGAEEAFHAMVQEAPHLVIADWKMKPVSGYQLLRAIRHKDIAPLCTVPLIMISGHATRSLVESAYQAGAHSFLVKPIAPAVLYRAIQRVLADRRSFQLDGDALVIDGVSEKLAASTEARKAAKAKKPAVKEQQDMLAKAVDYGALTSGGR
jgi:two-component system phosphate regulon response regulator PhoB